MTQEYIELELNELDIKITPYEGDTFSNADYEVARELVGIYLNDESGLHLRKDLEDNGKCSEICFPIYSLDNQPNIDFEVTL